MHVIQKQNDLVNTDMNQLETAIRLRDEGRLEESNIILRKLADSNPADPTLQYQYAWSFDVLGQEKDAIPYYERAISLGLAGEDLRGAYLGLGSTYRAIGAYAKSKDVFRDAIETFPHDNALKTFYALTLHNLGEHAAAMEILLTLLADTSSDPDVIAYHKAIKLYASNLDQVWE